jgi:hypothetical protein
MISRCGVQRGVYIEDEDETDLVNRPHGGCLYLTRSARMIIHLISKSIQAPVEHTKAFSAAPQPQMDKATAIQRVVSFPPRTRNKKTTPVEDSALTMQTPSVSIGCPTGQLFIIAMKVTNTNTIRLIPWIAALLFTITETQGMSTRYTEIIRAGA